MKIGNNVQIASGIHVDRPEGVIIGDNCFIYHHVHFHIVVQQGKKVRELD